MLSFLCKNLLKISANASLKSSPFCILNQTHRYFSETVHPHITEKTNDDIVSLFKTYGFTQTQISSLFSKRPLLLSFKKDTIKPKLDFFFSYGFSSTDLCRILAANPNVIRSSLNNRIIPCCEFLKGILKDNRSVIDSVKMTAQVLRLDLGKNMGPNIELLRNYGIPDSRISLLIRTQPRNLLTKTYRLKMLVQEIKELGFHPVKRNFVDAIHVMNVKKSIRERKWDLFRKWGLSDDEILSAFKMQPLFVATSEDKIERVMDFLVNKMGWNASKVSSCPTILMHSLESWTKPRCLVIQFLLSKGVLKKNFTLASFIVLKEDRFKERFLDKYCVEYPEMLKLYGRSEDNRQMLQVISSREPLNYSEKQQPKDRVNRLRHMSIEKQKILILLVSAMY